MEREESPSVVVATIEDAESAMGRRSESSSYPNDRPAANVGEAASIAAAPPGAPTPTRRRRRRSSPAISITILGSDENEDAAYYSSSSTSFASSSSSSSSFVDLVLPPPPKGPPYPAKYKATLELLWLVIWTDLLLTEAAIVPWLQRHLACTRRGALLIVVTTVVFMLLYSAIDVLYYLLPGPVREWLDRPNRIQWVKEYRNVPVECIAAIIEILEDGLRLFDTPPDDDQDDDDEQQHMVAPQRPSLMNDDKNNNNSNHQSPFHHQLDHHGLFDQEDNDDDDDDDDDRCRECTLKIRQRIRPDKVVDFQRWRRRLLHAMDLLDDDLAKNRHGVIAVQWDAHSLDDENQETRITFQSIDDLNAYMLSPIRRRFLRRLQPLLVSPSHVQVRRGSGRGGGRHNHNNAMTDLCHTQKGRNKERPVRPPKKWKVWFITTLALYSVVLLVDECLPHYLDAWWGLVDVDVDVDTSSSSATTTTTTTATATMTTYYYERLAAQVLRNICTTVLNAYVATPFLTMIFRHWLLRRRRRRRRRDKDEEEEEEEDHQPWIFWSDGAESIRVKMMICITFYGGIALAWYLQRAQR